MKTKYHWLISWQQALIRPEMAIFPLVIGLAGIWSGIQGALLLCALALWTGWITRPRMAVTEAPETAERILTRFIESEDGPRTGCLVVGLDQPEILKQQCGPGGLDALDTRIAERLRTAVRGADCVAHVAEGQFAVLLSPTRTLHTESVLQIAVRLQLSCEMPFDINGRMVSVSLHCGGCPPERAPDATAHSLLTAATIAADLAKNIGPGTIRLAPHIAPPARAETPALSAQFQPRINTSTGRVSGMMAVPHRLHRMPSRPPVEFSETLVQLSSDAIRFWNKNGLEPFPVAMRLPPYSLHENGYLNRMIWDVDRQDLPAERFSVVIGNGMLTGPDGARTERVIHNLSQHGIRIEMNGLDTAVLTTRLIRTLNIACLRLPRTLTRNILRHPEHQRMAAALITMADQLGIETAADGVSTLSELSLLAQLGCTHVSGPTISPPLPMAETAFWVRQHESKLAPAPQIGIRPAD